VKRSGRDEPVWIAIHKFMEVMLGISLDSYIYLKQQKCCLSYLLSFLFNQIGEQDNRTGSVGGVSVEEKGSSPHNVYTCK
jgi:hypothetical protein